MGSVRRVRVIVNPSARSGRAAEALRHARRLAAAHPLEVEWVTSRSAGHLGELVRAAQGDGRDALAVAGGDGTVGLALGALAGPNRVPLGVLPAGSGNDFARDLGIHGGPADALGVLAGGAPHWV